MPKVVKKKNHRTIARCILDLLKQKESITSEDVRHAYIVKTRKIPTRQAYNNAVKRLEAKGKISVSRYGSRSLTLTSVSSSKRPYDSMVNLNLSTNQPKRPIHSAHHLKFTIPYEGQQPTKGAITKPWGRYKTAIQAIYYLGEKITLQVFKKSIRVSTYKPEGIRTEDQIKNAKAQSYIKVANWAKQFNLKLGYFMEILHSHHVVENKYINEFLRPLFEEHGKEIYELLGSHICHSSHKGKIEHEGRSAKEHPKGRETKGHKVASGLESVFLDMPNALKELKEEQKFNREERKESMKAIGLYTKQIQLHLNVLDKIGKTLKKMEKKL